MLKGGGNGRGPDSLGGFRNFSFFLSAQVFMVIGVVHVTDRCVPTGQ